MGFDNVNINVSGPVQPTSTYKTKILKGNHSFATQVTEPNMKYVIKYDFDLGGESITIPEGCLLEFDGGTISNGTLVGQNTILIYNQPLNDILTATLEGTWRHESGVKADEEDITDLNGELKFKDKNYAPADYSGLGRKYLRKNLVNGVNTLTQAMMQDTNTIYIIQYDFTLGEDITVPANCVLEFEGGSLNNGTIIGQNTSINAIFSGRIFDSSINIEGTWRNSKFSVCWIGALPTTERVYESPNDMSHLINKCLAFPFSTVYIPQGYYYIGNPLLISTSQKTLELEGLPDKAEQKESRTVLYTYINIPIIQVEYKDNSTGEVNIKGGALLVVIDSYSCGAIELKGSVTSKIWGGRIETAIRLSSNLEYTDRFESEPKGIYIHTTGGYVTFLTLRCKILGFSIATKMDDREGGWITTITEENDVDGCRQAVVSYTHGLNNYNGRVQVQELVPKDGSDEYPVIYSKGSNCVFSERIIDLGSKGSLYPDLVGNNIGIKMHPNDKNNVICGASLELYPRFVYCTSYNLMSSQCLDYPQYNMSRGVRAFNPIYDNYLVEGKTVSKEITTIGCSARFTEGYLDQYSPRRPQALNVDENSKIIVNLTFLEYKNFTNKPVPLAFCAELPLNAVNRFNNIKIELLDENENVIKTFERNIEDNSDNPSVSRVYFNDLEIAYYQPTRKIRVTYSNPTAPDGAVYFGRFYMKAETFRRFSDFERVSLLGADRPTYPTEGLYYFDTTLNKPIWWTGSDWVDATGTPAGAPNSGTFANKPTVAANNIPVGFKYFCTDKQTTEGATNGIEIIHKGSDVWVDALGRVVS